MIVYGIKLRPRHRQRSSHNNIVLPTDMQFVIPCPSETIFAQENYPDHDLIKPESRMKRGPQRGRGPGPKRIMP
ncbi:hypothetical protein TNCV_1222821 [Trichonephila clavipes]|nr:hypothetical protein TNCV_1222821 [Trichonephila clavipes]